MPVGPLWALLGPFGPFWAMAIGLLFFQNLTLFKQIQNIVLNDAVYFPVLVPSKTFIILVICLTSGRFYGCDKRIFGLGNEGGMNVRGARIKA